MADIDVKMILNNQDFQKGIEDSKQSVSGLDKTGEKLNSGGMSKGLKAIKVGAVALAGAFVGVMGAVGNLVRKELDHIDSQAKLADRYGVSMEAMGEFELIASQTGTSSETLGRAVQDLTLNLFDAGEAGNKTGEALGLLGLTVDDIKDLEPEKQFYLLAESIQGVESQSEQARIAQDLFGRSGRDLLGVIRSSGDSLDDLAGAARDMGLTMSRDAARGVEQFNDSLDIMGKQKTAAVRELTLNLIPALNDLVIALNNAGNESGFLKDMLDFMTDAMSGSINMLTTLINMTSEQGRALNVQKGEADALSEMYNGLVDEFGSWEDAQKAADEGNRDAELTIRGYALTLDGLIGKYGEASVALNNHRIATGSMTAEIKEDIERPISPPPVRPVNTKSLEDAREKIEEEYAEMLENVVAYTMTAEETTLMALQKNREDHQENLDALLEAGKISQDEYNDYMLEAAEQNAAELKAIADNQIVEHYQNEEKKTKELEAQIRARMGLESQAAKNTKDILSEGSKLMGNENKKLHKIGKAAALGNAGMYIAEGLAKALTMGPIAGGIYGALVSTVGATQIATIKNTKAPSFAQGAYEIPNDMFAQIHKGETILPKPFAEDFRNKAENKGGSGGDTYNIIVQGSIIDQQGFMKNVGTALHNIQNRSGQQITKRSVY